MMGDESFPGKTGNSSNVPLDKSQKTFKDNLVGDILKVGVHVNQVTDYVYRQKCMAILGGEGKESDSMNCAVGDNSSYL